MAITECPGCKQQLLSRVDMCPQCGYPVQIPRQPVNVDHAGSPARSWMIQAEGWAAAIGVVLIIIGLAAANLATWIAGAVILVVALVIHMMRRRRDWRNRGEQHLFTEPPGNRA